MSVKEACTKVITEIYEKKYTRIDPVMHHLTLYLIFWNFENLYHHNHESEKYHTTVEFTVSICSFRESTVKIFDSELQDLYPVY